MKKKLCCIFNYAPLYRSSIYKKIDETFDAQFYFSDMKSDIAKMDYNTFKKYPKTVRDRKLLGKLLWRKDILGLPFKDYDSFLIIGDFSISYIPLIIFAHLLNKKVYAWGHGAKNFDGKAKYIQKWFYHNCDIYFTYGEGGKERLIDLGVPQNRLHVIYNSLNEGVDSKLQKKYNSDIIKTHFGNDNPTVLFVGRLTKVKQLDWIIEALKYHNEQNFYYNVLIIGDGTEKVELQQMVEEAGLSERVWFYGECYDDSQLNTLIYNSDLCVSPGNVGLTALTAMIYGTPVLSHDDFETQMPEYETIIDGKTGILYQKGNFADFCNKIKEWFSLSHDRSDIRNNCYSVINNKYNSDYQIRLLKNVIK